MRTEKPVHRPWPAGNLAKKKRDGLESPECTRLSPGGMGDLAARHGHLRGKESVAWPSECPIVYRTTSVQYPKIGKQPGQIFRPRMFAKPIHMTMLQNQNLKRRIR